MDREIEQDFTRFVRDRTSALFRVAYALTGEQHGAEDLLQTAFARAAARWSRIHGDPEAYVRRVLYHQHITRWRYRRRRPETLMAELPEHGRPGAVHADPADQTVTRLRLRAALRALPPRQRAVVVLRYLEDLSERADGTQIVYRSLTTTGKTAVRVADAATGHDRMLPAVPDTGSTGPAWLPGRAEFAIGADNQGPQSLAQVYDAATGQATGTSIVFDTLNNWSPDGGYVIRTSDCSIVEAASGSVVTQLDTDCYGSRVYWAGNDNVVMLRYGSKADDAWVRYDLKGNEVAVVPMPKEFGVDEEHTYTLVKK